MSRAAGVSVCAAWLLASTLAIAHHAFSPVYDAARTVTVVGVVTAFRLVNPHAQLTLDVADEAGNTTSWEVEFDGLLNLSNDGWTEDTIAVGERVSVTGNPTHTGSPRMFFLSLERRDGSALVRPALKRFEALERERRRRSERRDERAPEDTADSR